MTEHEFELPRNIDRYLAALQTLYAEEGLPLEQEILVNARVTVHEGTSFDNWNGGTHGHELRLSVPATAYGRAARQMEDLQTRMKTDINKLHNVPNEWIDNVFIEMEPAEDRDWRRASGLLQRDRPTVSTQAELRIWGDSGFRVFLSHKAEVKREAAEFKERCRLLGVSCFVAHTDIHPTREWQAEIEAALVSMDAFVAFLTKDYHESLWTDQEVGFALCSGVPMVSVKLGMDPYGFMGKFQALSCSWQDAPREVVTLLIKNPRMMDAYISAVKGCTTFDDGNTLAEILPSVERLSQQQVEALLSAYNENDQVSGSYGFNGEKSSFYGRGLAFHLSRMTGGKYKTTNLGKMQAES